jgi:putative phosphoesterase
VPGVIGLISDTHGLLRPEAIAALRGCGQIIHAGDVGAPDILDRLRALAPVLAVRGNVDDPSPDLPYTRTIDFDGRAIHVIHILADLDRRPPPPGIAAVVYGHSHKPAIEERRGVLYVNPGSAGPKRFNLPATVARMWIEDGRLTARIVPLETVAGSPEAR